MKTEGFLHEFARDAGFQPGAGAHVPTPGFNPAHERSNDRRQTRPSLLLALLLGACCQTTPDGPAGASSAPEVASADPSASAEVSAVEAALVKAAGNRGEYKAAALARVQELDARIQRADAGLKKLLDAQKSKARMDEIRDARWKVEAAYKAVERSGLEDFSKAKAEFEATCGALDRLLAEFP